MIQPGSSGMSFWINIFMRDGSQAGRHRRSDRLIISESLL